MKKSSFQQILCISLVFLLSLSILSFSAGAQTSAELTNQTETGSAEHHTDSNTYQSYFNKYRDMPAGTGRVVLKAFEFEKSEKAAIIKTYESKENAVFLDDTGGSLTYSFETETDGRYTISALYNFLANDSALDINLSFLIDGELPFEEAETVYLSKAYKNETAITTDKNGNELRPNQVESPRWVLSKFIDNSGYNPNPFELYLMKGKHTLTIKVTQDTAVLSEFVIQPADTLQSYSELQKEYQKKGYRQADGEVLEIRAELADEKSNPSIYPFTSRANAALQPSDPSRTKLNVIYAGQQGEWMSWKVSVKESGLYRLGFRVLQDENRGMVSTWRLYIDGSVPFAEASALEIPYSLSWQNYIAGNGDPFLFYLEAGTEHTITLECSTGRFAETLGVIRSALSDLNVICRKMTMVVGISPDLNRDFNFDAEIPDLEEELTAVRNLMQAELNRLNAKQNFKGSELVEIEDIIRQINAFLKNKRSIPASLSNFRTNISSLASWMLDMTNQGVLLDTVAILTKDSKMSKANAGFFEQLKYDFQSVLASFYIDYNSFDSQSGDENRRISVWISSGRDQANIIRNLSDNKFTPKTGISTALSIVTDSSVLLQATLAGKGPNVALFVEKTIPVNLAARGALVELSQFKGFDDITTRFYDSAFIPYRFAGGVYGIPNSQGFNVMFVRNDIFAELNLTVPETWDEFYKILPVIQRSNMKVGVMGDQGIIFETLIMQHGGKFYNDTMTGTEFGTKNVLDAFKMWTGFYKEYGLPVTYDAFSYFRSGTMPIMIADYTQYNMLAVAAPEIKGLWGLYPIPGIKNEDGTINRTESAVGTAGIMIKSTKDKDAAFQFLNWWSTTEIQTDYSREQELSMGPAARYNSANVKTLANLPWKKKEYTTISEQWKHVSDIPSIPSSYYVSRNIANAFRAVVYKNENERETLNKYSEIIDKEIIRKNKELGITG